VAEIVTERSRGARDLGERDSKKCCKVVKGERERNEIYSKKSFRLKIRDPDGQKYWLVIFLHQ
jgi:hypothetical protein